MTKTVWILGAVVVVGIGIAAGLIFAGGNEPPLIATESAKGSGNESQLVTSIVPEAITTAPIQEATAENDLGSKPEVVEPIVSSEESGSTITIATIDELIAGASSYGSREIIARGTIVTQCIAGCTFSLEDGTGVVSVELIDDALDNVLSGGSIGRQVEVRGTVERSPYLVIVVEDPDGWRYLD